MQPRKVLVADDSKLMHKMYEVMLRQYPLVYALDGREALDRLRQHRDVNLVLLDINMPHMDGLEFLAEMKADEQLARIPVIVVTVAGRDEDTSRALEAGATAHIKKPFQSDEILDVIARLEEPEPAA